MSYKSVAGAVALAGVIGAGGVALSTLSGKSAELSAVAGATTITDGGAVAAMTIGGTSFPAAGGCLPKTTYTVAYTDDTFKAASTAASKTLFALSSAREKLCLAVLDPQSTFAGTAISAMACSLGTSTSGNEALYLTALDMMQTTSSRSQAGLYNGKDVVLGDASAPDSSLDVVLHCTSTGASFGNGSATALTTGKVWVTVFTVQLPAGT